MVSSSICDEVLLSWQTLKKVGVIPENFPHVSVKAAAVTVLPSSTTEDEGGTERVRAVDGSGKDAREAQDAVTQMIVEFGTVFNEEGQLKPMKGDPMEIHMREDVPIKPLSGVMYL